MFKLFYLLMMAFVSVQSADAQTYPSRPVRMLVGFAPGGATDIASRITAQKLTETVGQSFVVENRPGASAMIAAELVSKATPDGYTLLVGTQTSHAVAPSLFRKIAYDPVRDFAPVTVLASSPLLLTVHPSLPVKSVSDLIALAKSKPGQLTYGSGGSGTSNHLTAELFKIMAGVNLLHVPYKGEGYALPDAMAGHISTIFLNLPSGLPLARNGKLRGLAVTSLQRVPTAAEFPTVADSGLTGFELASWFGMFAPPATPREIITILSSETTRVLNMQEVKDRMAAQGIFVIANTPEQFADYLKAEIAKYARVIREAGIKPESE